MPQIISLGNRVRS